MKSLDNMKTLIISDIHTKYKLAEKIIDDENPEPFKEKMSALKKKVIQQTQGPLYDSSIPNEFQKVNEADDGINRGSSEPFQSFDLNEDPQKPNFPTGQIF